MATLIPNFTPAQIAIMSTAQIAALTTEDWAAFSPAQLVALTSMQIPAIQTAGLRVLTLSQVAAFEPADVAYRASVISGVDKDAPTGVSIVKELTAGPTATAYDFSEPCFSLE